MAAIQSRLLQGCPHYHLHQIHFVFYVLPKAKVYSRKVQLQLNIHECRQVAPCPIAFPIKQELPKTTRPEAWNSMELKGQAL